MQDVYIGFFNDWSRMVMESKVFLIVKNEYIHNQNIKLYLVNSNFLSKSSICKLQVTIILLMRQ